MAAGVATVIGKIVGHTLATVSHNDLTVIDLVASSTSVGQTNPLGTVVQDDAGGEYIYLSGAASTVAGDWVFYDELWATTRAVTSSVGGPVAVALAAVNLTTSFGWYAIKHPFVFGKNISDTMLDDSGVFVTATAGSVDDEGAAGTSIYGAINRTLGTTTSSNYQIVYPFCFNIAPQ